MSGSASLSSPVPERLAGWTLQRLPQSAAENYAGKLFAGRYMLLRKIGGGGMSTIYEARDATLGVRVVVKIMRADLPNDPVDRFRREALVLAKLTHEHIARILDRQDPDDGPRFFVTEYIDGLDLGVLRGRGPTPAAVVLRIGLQVTAALAYAHAEGVLHRDIKPSNMMLVRHPGGDVFVKVIDFGLVKLSRGSELADEAPPGARRATRGDAVAGTAPYWNGHEGPQRDVYALALSLAEMLTGEEPDPTADLTREHIPPALAEAITAALRAEITTMDAFHTALREADVQEEGEGEAERRRYAAGTFRTARAGSAPVASEASWFAGRYIICGELGAGGMGRVQIAFDMGNRRKVALKTIQPKCAGMTNLELRFRREARALAAIEHPGTPILYESSAEPEPYFTMEIVEGMTLAAVLRQGKLEPLRALGLAIDLANILHAAHEVGVIHRDVKPGNIVIGQGDRVRLLDFGACLLMPRFHQRCLMFPATPPEERYATGELEKVGTPGYTAPEVLEMRGGAGPRSDIYSVCVLLYEMLTGRPYASPWGGRAPTIERAEFPAALGPVAEVLRRGTAREPSERMWSMVDLVRSLEIVRAGLTAAQRRRQLSLAVLLAVMSTAALLVLGFQFLAPKTTTTDGVTTAASASPTTMPESAPPAPTKPPVDESVTASTSPPTSPEPAPSSASPESPVSAATEATGALPLVSPLPEAAAPSSAPVLTAAKVRQRLTTRHKWLEQCNSPLLVLDLKIAAGRATLSAANGMAEGDPLYACVRAQLRGLSFPMGREDFTVTIHLGTR